MTSPPDLSFLLPAANENRWSDLLAAVVSTDPGPLRHLLGVDFDTVRREVSVARPDGRRQRDRLDLLLEREGRAVAVIEVKVLSDLGPRQLERYEQAFPDVSSYQVLHLSRLPVGLSAASAWKSLTWETVLTAYAQESRHPWVRVTASAWLSTIASVVPQVGPATVWNDVPDDAPGFELALRARIAWLGNQLDATCTLEHDMVQSSGGGNWCVRMRAPSPSAKHYVAAELQEGLTAYEWKPKPERPYRERLPGPVVLLGLWAGPVTTSEDFDWDLLGRLANQLVDPEGEPPDGRAWQRTPARPTDPVDRARWQAMVDAGMPRWVGKGWGMRVAKSAGECHFGARYALPPTSTLAEVLAELDGMARLVERISTALASPAAGSRYSATSTRWRNTSTRQGGEAGWGSGHPAWLERPR